MALGRGSYAVAGSILLLGMTVARTLAAVFDVAPGDVAALKAAIATANSNGEANTIHLAGGTYELSAVDNTSAGGPNGLPVVVGRITVDGGGATLRRAAGAPPFRILEVGAAADLTLSALTVSGGGLTGTAPLGAGVLVSGAGARLTLSGVTVTGNAAPCGGGGGLGLSGNGYVVDVSDSVVSGNSTSCPTTAGGFGGGIGISTAGTFTMLRTTVDGNTTTGNGCDGVGVAIEAAATVTIRDSTISRNACTSGLGGTGGGISDEGGATVLLTNVTISGNTLLQPGGQPVGDGGGIDSAGGGTMTLNNVTITGNTADHGGGIGLLAGSVRLMNTILAGNTVSTGGADCFTGPGPGVMMTSGDHNLVGSTDGCGLTVAAGDIVGMDPLLGPLGMNGGPTATHALLPASPAIDHGDPAPPGSGGTACEAADQRGVQRPQGPACDVGAFEAQREICGNCIDDDGNGRVDFEDDACCAGAQVATLTLKRGRIKPGTPGADLRLQAALAQAGLVAGTQPTQALFVQLREGNVELLCAEVPASAFTRKKKGIRSTSGGTAAKGLDRLSLVVRKNGSGRFNAAGGSVTLVSPAAAGRIDVTVALRDPTTAETGNRCSRGSGTFRASHRGVLRSP